MGGSSESPAARCGVRFDKYLLRQNHLAGGKGAEIIGCPMAATGAREAPFANNANNAHEDFNIMPHARFL